MKRTISSLAVIFLLGLLTAVSQPAKKNDLSTSQLKKAMKKWHQQMLVDKNLDIVKNVHSNLFESMTCCEENVQEWTVVQTMNESTGQFEKGNYTSVNVLPNPAIFDDQGTTAWVFSTITYTPLTPQYNKANTMVMQTFELYKHKNGQWISQSELAARNEASTISFVNSF